MCSASFLVLLRMVLEEGPDGLRYISSQLPRPDPQVFDHHSFCLFMVSQDSATTGTVPDFLPIFLRVRYLVAAPDSKLQA